MTTAEVFAKYLSEQDCPLPERIGFAIDCWQSIDLICASKYEVITRWLAETLHQLDASEACPTEQVCAYLNLQAQPGLVSAEAKRRLINALLDCVARDTKNSARAWADVFYGVARFVLLQDVLRTDYELTARVYAVLLRNCECHHRHNELAVSESYEEKAFLENVLNSLKEYIRHVERIELFALHYSTCVRVPLCQLIIVLQSRGLQYYEIFVELEQLLQGGANSKNDYKAAIDDLYSLPLYVCLMSIKCNLRTQRHNEKYISLLLMNVFSMPLNAATAPERMHYCLSVAYYTLVTLRELEITLHFEIESKPCLRYLETCIIEIVRRHKQTHLAALLKLLSATLAYNPLVLESAVFQISAWMLYAQKRTLEEQCLYEQYMQLLLHSFLRMGRCETLLKRLLTAIRQTLESYVDPDALSESTENGQLAAAETDEYLNMFMAIKTQAEAEQLPVNVTTDDDGTISFPSLRSTWPSKSSGLAFIKLVSNLKSKPSLTFAKMLLFELKDLLVQQQTATSDKALFLLDLHAALLCQYLCGARLTEHMHLHVQELAEQRVFLTQVLGQFGAFVLAAESHASGRLLAAFLECSYYNAAYQCMQCYYKPDGYEHTMPTNVYDYLNAEAWQQLAERAQQHNDFNCPALLQRLSQQRAHVNELLTRSTASETPFEPPVSEMHTIWQLVEQKIANICDELRQHSIKKNLCLLALADCSTAAECAEALKTFASTKKKQRATEYPLGAIRELMVSCDQLALTHLRSDNKAHLCFWFLALHYDMRTLASSEDLRAQLLHAIEVLIRFGQSSDIVRYLPFDLIVTLLPIDVCWPIYEALLVSTSGKSADKLLNGIAEWIRAGLTANATELGADRRQMLLATIAVLGRLSGLAAKAVRKHFAALNKIYDDYLRAHFANLDAMDADVAKFIETHQDFVEQTLPAYAYYLQHAVAQKAHGTTGPTAIEIDQTFRDMTKIYIGSSMNYRNQHGVRLMKIALTYHKQLAINQSEIDGVLTIYWKQLCSDLQQQCRNDQLTLEHVEAVKLIISSKSDSELQSILVELNRNILSIPYGADLQNTLALLALMCNCTFSAIKAAIFNEQFKDLITKILLRLQRDERQRLVQTDTVLCMLRCLNAAIKNKTMVLSTDTLDAIIASMADFALCLSRKDNLELFVALHSALTEVCLSVMKHRYLLIADRTSQLLATLFEDLLRAIIAYTDDKGKGIAITESEVNCLADLSLKLRTIIDLIVANGLAFKRIAPITLINLLNMFVSLKRPTTLYPSIKLNVHAVCHGLIKLCPRQAEKFILRESSDAGGQLYKILLNEHKKYYKFTGKI